MRRGCGEDRGRGNLMDKDDAGRPGRWNGTKLRRGLRTCNLSSSSAREESTAPQVPSTPRLVRAPVWGGRRKSRRGGPNAAKAESELAGSCTRSDRRNPDPRRSLGAKMEDLIGSPGCWPGRLTDAGHWRDSSTAQSGPATAARPASRGGTSYEGQRCPSYLRDSGSRPPEVCILAVSPVHRVSYDRWSVHPHFYRQRSSSSRTLV